MKNVINNVVNNMLLLSLLIRYIDDRSVLRG